MRQELIDWLRQQGFRLTNQRLLILDVIEANNGHISADDIATTVTQRDPRLNRATVYRTLQWLHSVGMLRKIDVGTPPLRYELAAEHAHHHLICRDCGYEQEIDHHVVATLQAHILEHYDFAADPDHLAIFGRCAHCRQLAETDNPH